MSEMYDPTIMRLLQKAAIAAVAASTMPNLPIAGISVDFNVPDDQKYLELIMIPNNRTDDFWGGEKNYQGMFRLILHWPKDNEGPYIPGAALASICSHFGNGDQLGALVISAAPNFMGALVEAAEILYPASLRYTCYRS